MKKAIKVYLMFVFRVSILVGVILGVVCIISAVPKLNELFCNATGGTPIPWEEAKKNIPRALPNLIFIIFFGAALLFLTECPCLYKNKDRDKEDNDDEKKN